MKRLYLMRHGDAERGGAETSDHARPLSEEGREETARAGAWLRASGGLPAQVMCSTALRARQTLEALGLPEELSAQAGFHDPLYLASPGELLHFLQTMDEGPPSVLLIGHNPGIRDFCAMFAQRGEAAAREEVALGFKTAGLARLSFEVERWRDVPGSGGGRLDYYRDAY